MLFLVVAVAVVTAAPLVAAVLVTIASLREEFDQSLTGRPPGPFTAAARRLLRARVGAATGPRRTRLRIRRRLTATDVDRRAGVYSDGGSHARWVPGPRSAPRGDSPDGADGSHHDVGHPDGAGHALTMPRR